MSILRWRGLPHVLAVFAFAAYTTLSATRHQRLRTSGFDLGIFEQAVRGYAGLRLPTSDLKGPGYALLGDHFHPILAVLGPVYRIIPSPYTLLVAQAALLAASVLIVTRLSMRLTGPATGAVIGLGYALSSGIQQAVGFDFHEICFGVPLLAASLAALAEGRWTVAAAWAAPLVLVKEDLPLTVAAVGAYLLLHRMWALGTALLAFALTAGIVIMYVAIPSFGNGYAYASSVDVAGGLLAGWDVKATTLLLLLAPTAFVAARSPLILIAAPTLAWRFASSTENHWQFAFHYGAILMPVLFIAFADGLTRMPARVGPRLAVAGLAVTLALCPTLPLRDLASPSYWATGSSSQRSRAVLDTIPDGATVAATNALAPQLTARTTVYLFPTFPDRGVRPDWVALLDRPDTSLLPADAVAQGHARLPELGYRMAESRDGIVLWRRTGGSP